MKGKPKTRKVPGILRYVVAENVNRRMGEVYRGRSNIVKCLAVDSGVAMSTVQRILAGTVGASIDNLEAVASALRVQTYQLLIPDERHVITAPSQQGQHRSLHQVPAGYRIRRSK